MGNAEQVPTQKPIEQFRCEVLDCWLSPKACAERYARAKAAKKGYDGEWLPDQWASYVASCRGCKIGRYHRSVIKLKPLRKPRQRKPQWRKGV